MQQLGQIAAGHSFHFFSFCRNRVRMMKALRALIAAPQNNLKVFKVR